MLRSFKNFSYVVFFSYTVSGLKFHCSLLPTEPMRLPKKSISFFFAFQEHICCFCWAHAVGKETWLERTNRKREQKNRKAHQNNEPVEPKKKAAQQKKEQLVHRKKDPFTKLSTNFALTGLVMVGGLIYANRNLRN